ncbi:MAG: hypothetical protein KJZ81_08060 [Burkholderiaceae bacterium]|nr:hypothetical protein [Burkholderiaceae bacterium]
MAIPLETLESEVLRLSAEHHRRLPDRVVASLDEGAARDAAWNAVAAGREAQAEEDPRLLMPLADALDRLRAELK